jgi:hypothetical protein
MLRANIVHIEPTLISWISWRRRHLILVIIWLLVWPVLVEVVGNSTDLALGINLVIISLWSYRVLAKNFVKILFNKRALFRIWRPKE